MPPHEHAAPEEPETQRKQFTLSADSPIQLGLIIGLLGLCAGGFSIWIWWAASISTKLDMLINDRKEQAAAITGLKSDITAIQSWKAEVTSSGTPVMVRKMEAIELSVQELRRELDIHKAASKP